MRILYGVKKKNIMTHNLRNKNNQEEKDEQNKIEGK
jgi:hypothetical protein